MGRLARRIAADPALAGGSAALAKSLGLSPSRLRARVREATGQSLGDWLMRLRIHAAMRMLAEDPGRPITDIALQLDFSSSQYFATCFRRYAAMSPTRFRDELASDRGRRRLEKVRDPWS